jgi:hypothetical protein
MPFIILVVVLMVLCVAIAMKLSPYTERLMDCIWQDPTTKMKVKIAKRVKELCIDGHVPDETAALMIAKENNIMEEQVRELMRFSVADPTIMRMAFGSKVGGLLYKGLKKFGALGG